MRPETRLLDYIDEMAPPVSTKEAVARRQSPNRSWVRVAPATKRREGVLTTKTEESVKTQTPGLGRGLAWAVAAFAVVLAVAGLYFAFSGDDGQVVDQTTVPTPTTVLEPEPEVQGDVPFEQMATISQLVDAVNVRDVEAFIDSFTAEGYFNPHGEFRESSSFYGQHQPVGQVSLVQAWMAIIDAWGLEADLLACNVLTNAEIGGLRGNWGWPRSGSGASLVRCDVATRWHGLSLELTEGWVYEFRGTQLDNWGFVLLDLNPDERTLPLGYDGLEAWEAWLEVNDPLSADRYLNPRVRPSDVPKCDGCEEWEAALAPGDPELAARLGRLLWPAEKEWSIDGHEFTPGGLIPYDPALADEIEASIHEYLETK